MITNSAINQNPFLRFAISHLPDRMKRIVYLASLTGIAKETNIPEQKLIIKLNQVLKLSTTDDAALKLPIYLSKLIWSNKIVFKADIETLTNCKMDDKEAIESADRIASSTPTWFTYGSRADIVRDLIALFTRENKIFRSDFKNTQNAF